MYFKCNVKRKLIFDSELNLAASNSQLPAGTTNLFLDVLGKVAEVGSERVPVLPQARQHVRLQQVAPLLSHESYSSRSSKREDYKQNVLPQPANCGYICIECRNLVEQRQNCPLAIKSGRDFVKGVHA